VIHSVCKTDLKGAGKFVEVSFAEIATESRKIAQGAQGAQGALNWSASDRLSTDQIQSFPPVSSLFRDDSWDDQLFLKIRSRAFDVDAIHKISPGTNAAAEPRPQSFVQIEIIGEIIIVSKHWLRPGQFVQTSSLRDSNNASFGFDERTEIDHRHKEPKGQFDDPCSIDAADGAFHSFRLAQEAKT